MSLFALRLAFRRPSLLALFCWGALPCSTVMTHAPTAMAEAPAGKSYSTRGTVKGFGEGRRSVSVAHDAIPGFMAAMTMWFDAQAPEQLRELAVGDRVRFTFVVTSDRRRVLAAVSKEAR